MLVKDFSKFDISMQKFILQAYVFNYLKAIAGSNGDVLTVAPLGVYDIIEVIFMNYVTISDIDLRLATDSASYQILKPLVNSVLDVMIKENYISVAAETPEAYLDSLKSLTEKHLSLLSKHNSSILIDENTDIAFTLELISLIRHANLCSSQNICYSALFFSSFLTHKFTNHFFNKDEFFFDLSSFSAHHDTAFFVSYKIDLAFCKIPHFYNIYSHDMILKIGGSESLLSEDTAVNTSFNSDGSSSIDVAIFGESDSFRDVLYDKIRKSKDSCPEADKPLTLAEQRKLPAYKSIMQYCSDLTLEYEKKEKTDKKPVCINRDKEIEQIMLILSKKHKNNVLILGEAGVGKSSVVQVLPKYFKEETKFKNKLIFSLDLSLFMSGTKYRGTLEEKIAELMKNLSSMDCILFIDEIHLITAALDQEGTNIGQYLKPKLAGSDITVIGATTFSEYKHIAKDKAFARRFDNVSLKTFDYDQKLKIVLDVMNDYARSHSVVVSESKALARSILKYAERYLYDRTSPDRELDLLDIACAYCKKNRTILTSDTLPDVLQSVYNIPLVKQRIPENVTEVLNSRVLGQDRAVAALESSLMRYKLGIKFPNKPLGSFLFQGPTGVGKTELAKALSEIIYNDELIRFNMSEYGDATSFSKFFGASAGYVGYNDDVPISRVRNKPYSVVLFDEIEKSYPAFRSVFLQILDEGRCEDSQGRIVDFQNTFVIFTTNVAFKEDKHVGFGTKLVTDATMRDNIDNLTHEFKREFLNRIDEIIPFNSLDSDETSQAGIVAKELTEFTDVYAKALKVKITYDDDLLELIAKKSNISVYGAREIKRTIRKLLERPLQVSIMQNVADKHISLKMLEDSDLKTVVVCDRTVFEDKSRTEVLEDRLLAQA